MMPQTLVSKQSLLLLGFGVVALIGLLFMSFFLPIIWLASSPSGSSESIWHLFKFPLPLLFYMIFCNAIPALFAVYKRKTTLNTREMMFFYYTSYLLVVLNTVSVYMPILGMIISAICITYSVTTLLDGAVKKYSEFATVLLFGIILLCSLVYNALESSSLISIAIGTFRDFFNILFHSFIFTSIGACILYWCYGVPNIKHRLARDFIKLCILALFAFELRWAFL